MQPKPGLTVAMIVRDERENLQELLPTLVEGIDDVVVVDTGSQDGTAELARSLGARVFEEPWADDFARARNRSLAEVRTSHVVWLDADDRVDADDLTRMRREALQRGDAGLMLLLVNESRDPNEVSSCWQLRVFPARAEHRFEGRIHEQVRESLRRTDTPIETVDITIRHTGYRDSAAVYRKSRRNFELLRQEIEDGHDDDISVLYHYVRAATRCGELEEAVRVARQCVEKPPPHAPREILQSIAVVLGRTEFQRGRLAEAEDVLREAVERTPNDPLARFFLGDLLRTTGDFVGAVREFQVARVSPIRNTTLPLPVAGLARAIRLQLGELLEILGQPAGAITAYREALEQQPGEPGVLRALARALITSGELVAADEMLARLSRTDHDPVEVLLLRATLDFMKGHDQEAGRLYREVEELRPRMWAAPLHLGHLALRNRDVGKALGHYERALALADNPETRVGLAAAQLEGGEIARSLENLAAAVEECKNRPLPPGTEALSGEAFLRIGRPGEALNALEKHLGRYGPDPRIVSRLADCYRELGQAQAARFGYQEALKLRPGLPEALRGLSELEPAR